MNRTFLAVTVAAALAAPALAGAAGATDGYLCYKAKALGPKSAFPRFPGRTADTVTDAFGPLTIDLKKVRGVCLPAVLDGVPIADAATHLESYKGKPSRTDPRQPKLEPRVHEIQNVLGVLKLLVRSVEGLLLPSALARGSNGTTELGTTAVDPFKCYAAKVAKAPSGAPPFPAFTRRQIGATDGFGTHVLDLRKPTRLCHPADLNAADPAAPAAPGHLVCYAARLARTDPRQPKLAATDVSTANVFGDEFLKVTALDEVCLPSLRDVPPATPTPTPMATPTVEGTPGELTAVRIGPARRVVDPDGAASFTATGDVSDGSTRNLTQKVTWTSSDPAIASVSNVDGQRGRVTGHLPGVVTITAFEPVSGLTSTAAGADGTFTVRGALERITLAPAEPTREVSGTVTFSATAHYVGGGIENVTQRLLYGSSAPAVAAAPNAEGNRSLVQALAPGVATITGFDPVSGTNAVTATLTVLGPLERIQLSPTSATRVAGTTQNYTATGTFGGGTVENITQRLIYSSSNLAVAVPINAPDARSKVETVGPGVAVISATDPITGLTTTATGDDVTLTVTGPLEQIELGPAVATRAVGEALNYRALGIYGGGTTKNLTQLVTYASSDPAVASAPNEDGNRSRVMMVGPGVATIIATDVATGIEATATLTVTGPLERIVLSPATSTRAVGAPQNYVATGHYGGGTTKNLTQKVVYASSDAAVAQASNPEDNRGRVDPVGAGTAVISARDPETGITSTASGGDATLTVTAPAPAPTATP